MDRFCGQFRGSSYEYTPEPCPSGLKVEKQMTGRPVENPPWTSEQEDQLRRLAKNGESIATVAERLNRSEQAIRHRARRLGITVRRVAAETKKPRPLTALANLLYRKKTS
jgi:hypothetical protein